MSSISKVGGKFDVLDHTRPDIAYAVNIDSQFMHDPKVRHLHAIDNSPVSQNCPRRIVTKKRWKPIHASVYRKSTSSYCMFLGG